MPTPDRTSLEEIVAAAWDILEAEGVSGLTMQAVAARCGVRAPSLYKRVRDRDALLALVAVAAVDELARRLGAAATLADIARTYRAFAHERPQAFRLIQSAGTDRASLARASEPVLRIAAGLVGEADALPAARLLTAWATGFLTMELAGAFRLGGDVDEAFEYGLARLTAALTRTGELSSPARPAGRAAGTSPHRAAG
ncbi:TetR/AcrR family transcriptional regulator [Cellulomonas dongxiuzhuiae]|uniref:TetR/AcrR family transcriptional regulator n=1 Tax=Cellulomonas dongxiuzhuiae TaxID=2819979 RepID=UPI001AAE8C4D|nr:TetR-like C-terminal domain-containing protein [Cellulomonas dongxiuzhuiae]MBO3088268.1 WHG domain-containing protein [Cellulomonas dongxiuzhuiae]